MNDISPIFGDISEEQSAINDDNRLHYFCTVLEGKFQGIANTLDIQL